MNRFPTIFFLAISVLLTGCATPNVKYSDLRPPTTATVSGDTITVHIGSDLMNSACFTQTKARAEGQTIYIVGYRTLREQSREFVVRLPGSVSSPAATVLWVDPDGSHVSVPIIK